MIILDYAVYVSMILIIFWLAFLFYRLERQMTKWAKEAEDKINKYFEENKK